MTSLLELFNDKETSSYVFGEILSISKGTIRIKTTTGLLLTINDDSGNYSVNDQIVLGSDNSDLSGTFIITKLSKMIPDAINYTIDLDSD